MNLRQLGSLALERGDYQEAINIFKRALEERKEAEAFVGFGIAHYHLEDMPTARWAFYKALERDPGNATAQEHVRRIEAPHKESIPPRRPRAIFRALNDHLEILEGTWKKFFIKGVNIGLGLPGYFPGEYAIKAGTYRKWFREIAELGANCIRAYTILPPDFYSALSDFNRSGKRLYLFQEIWTELPENFDFDDHRFHEELMAEIRNAVDAIFGTAALPERPGHAHGAYRHDVSRFLAGFIIGREWESWAVRGYNKLKQRKHQDYKGAFLSLRNGNPFEVWIARTCDYLQQYEHRKYGVTHPVTTVNWPTLDPLIHPSESTYEEESRIQGTQQEEDPEQPDDTNTEDTESLDLAKISVVRGSGFFALYHAYPYYPDFMNNDYLDQENSYLTYLQQLKQHHGRQPVVIAEFGVPSSRESAHWHQGGMHHGGHSEREQGRINALLMSAIHKAGMAGGMIFSWFDEWFKKNWLFVPLQIPADRKPLWFNAQDPEQNYGLLAAYPGYPGRMVSLAGRKDEWKIANILYENDGKGMAHRFFDGFDESRQLSRLAVQHDEGFLYVLLETSGPIDFSMAHYVIGLDTCSAGAGESLLPFGTNFLSPVGLTFLLHIAGRKNSRILAAAAYDRYLNKGSGLVRPEVSTQGAWVMIQNKTNMRRISKDGTTFYPSRTANLSRLRYGSLDRKSREYDSLADLYCQDNRVELRIPWGLINVTDPSSHQVLWNDGKSATRTTAGIRFMALSYKPEPGSPTAAPAAGDSRHTDCFPKLPLAADVRQYVWKGWDTPLYHIYRKESYFAAQKMFASFPEAT